MNGNAKNCDVLVAGGGIAGISAALSAARNGADVILVEKQCALGGLATLGMVTIYLPLCDGMGNQVIFGIGEELLRLSILDECQARYPKAWLENGTVEERKAKRFEVQYNPYLFALACEELLLNNGVRILYDCLITDVEMDGKRISAVNIHNKEGYWSIGVKAVVDGTGDGDICAFSGEETCCFTENRFAAWHYLCEKGHLRLSSYADSLSAPVPQHGRYYDGLDTDDITQMVIDGHRDILAAVRKKKADSSEEVSLATIPLTPSFRMTRRLKGLYELDDKEMGVEFSDSIGRTGDWRKAGPVYQIPYRCLYGAQVENLATAGRCISVTQPMWDITRVIPTCAVTGEAAGTAAALAAAQGTGFHDVEIKALQERLTKAGVLI